MRYGNLSTYTVFSTTARGILLINVVGRGNTSGMVIAIELLIVSCRKPACPLLFWRLAKKNIRSHQLITIATSIGSRGMDLAFAMSCGVATCRPLQHSVPLRVVYSSVNIGFCEGRRSPPITCGNEKR